MLEMIVNGPNRVSMCTNLNFEDVITSYTTSMHLKIRVVGIPTRFIFDKCKSRGKEETTQGFPVRFMLFLCFRREGPEGVTSYKFAPSATRQGDRDSETYSRLLAVRGAGMSQRTKRPYL